jgi:mono/diheme cytochrome c family protein
MSSNSSPSKPDLDESINVTQAHGKISREPAATAREKQLADTGHEPISLWVIAACGLSLLIAGAVLGKSGTWFDYKALVQEGYVRKPAPGEGDTGPKPKTALAAFGARGGKIYSAKCGGCHGSEGKGDGVNYPSLAGSDWVNGDTQKFAMVILNGLQGPTSNGKVYGAGVMPAQGAGMSPEDLATLMTFVRNSFGNTVGDVVSPEMAKNAMDISAARETPGSSVTAEELTAKHSKALEGAVIDPATMVNPADLTPIK